MQARLPHWAPPLVICCLGAALRLYTLDALSLWLDEGATVFFSRMPVAAMFGSGPASLNDTHPPLYYLAVKGMALLVPEVLAGRLVSALAGVATLPVVYLLGLRLAGRRAALLASLAFALSPMHIWYSREARPYGLAVLLVALSYLALLAAARSPRWRHGFAWSLATVLAAYVDYSAIYALLPQALILAVLLSRSGRWGAVQFGVGMLPLLAYLPWLPQLLKPQGSAEILNQLAGLYSVTPERLTSTVLCLVGLAGNGIYFYDGHPGLWELLPGPEGQVSVLLLLGLAALAGAIGLLRHSSLSLPIVVCLLVGTVATATLVSIAVAPAFSERAVLYGVLGWVLLLGAAATYRPRPWAALAASVCLAAGLLLPLWTTQSIYSGAIKQDWRGLATVTAQAAELGPPVFLFPTWAGSLVDVYQPAVLEIGGTILGDGGDLEQLRARSAGEDAVWLAYIETGAISGVRDTLADIGFTRWIHRYYYHPLYLDLYMRDPGQAGQLLNPTGSQYPAQPGTLYLLQMEAQSEVTGDGLRVFLVCRASSGMMLEVAPDAGGAAVPSDGAWHSVRVGVICPEDTTNILVDLRKLGEGRISFRSVQLWEWAGPGV